MNTEKMNEYLVSLRHRLHGIPEVGLELPETIKVVTGELESLGIEYDVIENGGIFGTIGQGDRTLLLRADMDALPIMEQSSEEFASTNGNMHACGHDLHTSMLLGAAKILKEKESELNARVILFFECDEESGRGIKTIIEQNVIEQIGVNHVMALHCLPGTKMKAGTYVCHEGPANSSIAKFNIHVTGKTAHGAMLHQGKNPINACVQIYNAISNIIPQEIDARRCAVMSICYLVSGDTAVANVVPDAADMGGTIRAHMTDDADYLMRRVKEIAKGITDSLNMECEVTRSVAYSSAMNDSSMVNLINECALELDMTNVNEPPQMVSDSFAFLTDNYPGAYVWIGAGGDEPKYEGGILHGPTTCFNDDTLLYGANLLAKVAIEYGKKKI